MWGMENMRRDISNAAPVTARLIESSMTRLEPIHPASDEVQAVECATFLAGMTYGWGLRADRRVLRYSYHLLAGRASAVQGMNDAWGDRILISTFWLAYRLKWRGDGAHSVFAMSPRPSIERR